MLKVKMCGITNLDDARLCQDAGADALGFIFWKKSPRYIRPTAAKKIIQKLSPYCVHAGVFMDEKKEKVLHIAQALKLGVLQFHGNESPSYCRWFQPQFKVVKTFFADEAAATAYQRYNVEGILFDIRWEAKRKGTKTISDEWLKKIRKIKDRYVILSGGLTPNNVLRAVRSVKPHAVDVASGVELFPGKKDERLVRLFIQKAKSI